MTAHGTFWWNELMTRNTEAAKAFYTAILGWSHETMDVGAGPYVVWKAGDEVVAGMLDINDERFDGAPDNWMSYIAVDDVDAVVAQVAGAGGTVLQPPFDIPTVGRIAMVADASGAVVGLATPAPETRG
ncbi:MAG: VOC family protein [Hyphomicrobiales bacterium]|nr:VOC family protein [Hyphomicrobiales bacterium]MCP5372663.1 VOC family protein [Hyphomicrobiales bacterium]